MTGYYLYQSKGKNITLLPVKISSQEILPGLKKTAYEGYPKGTVIEKTTEQTPINFKWSSENEKSYKSPFTIEWTGLLKIEHRCFYTFILGSDDGAKLFLNGKQIINNGGVHQLREKSQQVFLEPGFYRFHLRYFDQGGGAILYLKWRFLNKDSTVIPVSQFYQVKINGWPAVDPTIPYVLRIAPEDIVEENRIVFKKNDPTLLFNNRGILRTNYVNYWDNYRFKPPTDIPNYNILWRGYVWIPRDGKYSFKIDTNGDTFLFIGAEPIIKYRPGESAEAQVYLEKGWKPIQLNYFNTAKFATLNLLWQSDKDSKFKSIPSRYLQPFEKNRTFDNAKIWYGSGFIAAPFIIGLAFFTSIRERTREKYIQGYPAYVKGNWATVALIIIVILGATLRLDNYSVIPPHGDTMDSYQEAWNGYHILQGKSPKSWEYHYFIPAYKEKQYFTWFGDGFTVVKNYIAHPPLFSIFAGIPSFVLGAKDFLDCRLLTIRLVPIFFSTLTIIPVFFVARKIYRSHTTAVIASLLYATVPLFVVAGRIAKGDTLLSLVLISGVLCTLKYSESKRQVYVIFAGILAGLSFWCKEMGICAILIIPLLLGRKGARKEAFIAAGIGFFIAACYMLYNYLINPEAFFKILSLRSVHQSTTFNTVLNYIKESKLTQTYVSFGMGYLLWFWFVMIYSMGKRDQIVPIVTFIFLMTICALSKNTQTYGWFLTPLYPFMAIAGGVFLRDFISKPGTAKALLLLLVLVAVPLHEILPENLDKTPWLFRYYLAVGILPFLVSDFLKNQVTIAVTKTSCYIYISFLIAMNVYIVYHLQDVYNPL